MTADPRQNPNPAAAQQSDGRDNDALPSSQGAGSESQSAASPSQDNDNTDLFPAQAENQGLISREEYGSRIDDIENERTVISPQKSGNPYQRPSTRTVQLDKLDGQSLGHLHLKEYLGGGMSAVYRAVDESLARTVAVKILLPELKNDEYLRRFRNEAKNSARLDHENIARVFYIGTHEDLEYIVFEYVSGDNLRQLVEKIGPMSLDLAIRYTLQIAAALQHAYLRNVTHRDVKPSNAIITKGGRVKLVDMGLARYGHSTGDSDDVTSAGVTMGTFDYISPEQARDARSVDVRSDLYSLGCTLFFMLTGHPPYPDGTPIDKIMQHSSAQRPDPRLFRSDLPKALSQIVKKLLAPNPEMRYQSPDKLINDLMSMAGGNQIQLYGFEQAMVSTRKQGVSLSERILPVALPVAAIVSMLFLWEWFYPESDIAPGEPEQTRISMAGAEDIGDHKADIAAQASRATTPDRKTAGDTDADDPAVSIYKSTGSNTEVDPDSESPGLLSSDGEESSANENRVIGPTLPDEEIQQCVVGVRDPKNHPPETPVFATLDAVLREIEAGTYPAMRKIILQFDGAEPVSPTNLNSADLEITAGEDFQPTLLFNVEKKNDLLRMHAGNIKFSNVHFRVVCPAFGQVDQISLFDIQQPQILTLNQCSVTIVNSDDQNGQLQKDAAVFRIRTSSGSRMAFPEEVYSMSDPPVIQLTDCVIRGDATTVRSVSAVPFIFNFDNGLLVTPGRMIELGGSDEEPDMLNYDHPEIRLSHVTSITGSGLAQMNMSRSKPFHSKLLLDAEASIFKVGSGPLIDHVDLDPEISESDLRDVLQVAGANNFLPATNPVWAILYRDSSKSAQINYSIKEALSDGDWFEQENPRSLSSVVWQSAILSSIKPYHLQVPADYTISGSQSNSAVRAKAGFDVRQLPSIPVDVGTRQADFDSTSSANERHPASRRGLARSSTKSS